MNEKNGVLFSDEYQKNLKEQFCYADADPEHGSRLFFENSGGSLRLKKAVEAKASIEQFPDVRNVFAEEAMNYLTMFLKEQKKFWRLSSARNQVTAP